MSEELKPCPFCDNPAVEVQYNGPNEDQIKEAISVGHDWDVSYFVACWCGCTGPERAEEDAAIKGWNQRSATSQARLSEAVKVLERIATNYEDGATFSGTQCADIARDFLATLGEET